MRLLLLAGTSESRQIASALIREPRLIPIVSLARAELRPVSFGGLPTRIGGWGGDGPFADWLERERIEAVLDATHPFAVRMSHRAADVARAKGIDYLQFQRPPWLPSEGDHWTFLNGEEDAVGHIPEGSRVFVATGRGSLGALAGLDRHELLVRVTSPPTAPFPFSRGRFVLGRPPFSVADEVALFERLRVDWLLTRNAGGTGSRAKVDVARLLGIPVAMVRRPFQPQAAKVETIAEALAWVRRRL